jgi:hypothetical protein
MMGHMSNQSRYLGMGIALVMGVALTTLVIAGVALASEPARYPAQATGSDDVSALATTASITGRVTANSPAGPPLDGAFVYLLDSLLNLSVTTTTDSAGYYSATITADSGAVKVYFAMTGCTSLYYNGKTSAGSADVITLTQGGVVTGINAALPQVALGSISGIVTDAITTNPLPTTTVRLYDAVSNSAFATNTLTNQSGVYTLANLPAGSYKIGFSRQGYGRQFYAYTDTVTQATVLTLAVAGIITDVNGALGAATGCMTGLVTAASNGVPLNAVSVTVQVPPSAVTPVTQTVAVTITGLSADGIYAVCGLNGEYLVGFEKQYYVPQWYSNRAALAAADRVTVTDGITTPGINAALVLGGCVAGQVQDTDSISRPGAVITVLNSLSVPVGIPVPLAPLSDETFRVCDLAAGTYDVRCSDAGFEGRISATVTANQVTTGVVCILQDQLVIYMPVISKQ